MMRHHYLLIFLILLAIITACQPAPESETATPVDTDTAPGDTTPAPPAATGVAPAEEETPESYPAPPTPARQTEGYPVQAEPQPQSDPYPAAEGFVWVSLPVGVQCEEGSRYANLQEAVETLSNEGISVKDAKLSSLPVCTACGCPSSEHYVLQIAQENLDAALEMEWTEFTP